MAGKKAKRNRDSRKEISGRLTRCKVGTRNTELGALFYDVSARVATFYYKSSVTPSEMERSGVVYENLFDPRRR